MESHALAGDWEFRRTGGAGPDGEATGATAGEWRPATVPGDVYTDLERAGEIPDPHEADNELDVQWVAEADWAYRRTVEVSEGVLADARQSLVFEGLDTVADVFVNGERVGSAENMFRRYAFDVGDALVPGENEVRVAFTAPARAARDRAEAHPREVPTNRYPVDFPHRNYLRKGQCHFGWDWGICLPTSGIYRDVELLAHSGPRIEYAVPSQTHHPDGSVDLSVRVGLATPVAGEYPIDLAVDGEAVRETHEVPAGESEFELSATVEDPDLWWPRGYGDQPLSAVVVGVGEGPARDEHVERVGFREVEVVREPDDAGESFGFVVNGEPVYAKGANWIPVDVRHGHATADLYDDLLESAAAANMNMLRVWGGGIYECDRFYERCDELGLLVWQDFMFACSLYPGDEDFLASVEAEVRDQVRRLAGHPSVVLWCGNNENEEALQHWYDLDEAERTGVYRDAYDALYYDTVGAAVAEEDPDRTYWPSSPYSGRRADPYEEGAGDVHFWDVWHGGEPFGAYEDASPRFASEFGYQAFPAAESLAAVVPDDHLNPTAPLTEHHQRHPEGNALILRRMADHFRIPGEFAEFCYLSQLQQAIAMETAIEAWRRQKPHCAGTLYWQLNDDWPVASWSSIEYGGRWKALHHAARRFYAPVLVSSTLDGGDLAVWVTSDLREPNAGTVDVAVHPLDGDGEPAARRTLDLDLAAGASEQVGTVDLDAVDLDPAETIVRLSYDGPGEAADDYALREPYKRLALPDVDLDVTVADGAVTVEAPRAALFVELVADGSTRFADNYFHLVPGQRRTVDFEGDVAGDLTDALSVRHLRDTY